MAPDILITDGQQRKTLVAVRSLGRRNLHTTVGEFFFPFLSSYSRYCNKAVVYPSPKTQPEEFRHWLINRLQAKKYAMFLPMDDEVLDAVMPCRDEIALLAPMPVGNVASYAIARDKYLTYQLTEQTGVPHPCTILLASPVELYKFVAQCHYPLVLKPRMGSGSRGIYYIQNSAELDLILPAIQRGSDTNYLVQEYIPPGGRAIGVSVLVDSSHQAVATFTHQRLREYPITGGPSVLCESIRHPEAVALTLKLLEVWPWYGLAMMEFKEDPRTGELKLMEINPRPWGSIQLPVAAGIDFPFLVYQLAQGNDFAPQHTYKTGIRYRWLPGDMLHFMMSPDRWQRLTDYFYLQDGRTTYDLFAHDDWSPLLGFFISYGLRMVNAQARKELLR